ncbi:hypothetical protein ACFVVL_04365 [Kitasatospora sp. NPDC058115]
MAAVVETCPHRAPGPRDGADGGDGGLPARLLRAAGGEPAGA